MTCAKVINTLNARQENQGFCAIVAYVISILKFILYLSEVFISPTLNLRHFLNRERRKYKWNCIVPNSTTQGFYGTEGWGKDGHYADATKLVTLCYKDKVLWSQRGCWDHQFLVQAWGSLVVCALYIKPIVYIKMEKSYFLSLVWSSLPL